jgi:hypothetical protein
MIRPTIKKLFMMMLIVSSVGYMGIGNAHNGGATMDAEGVSATFTGLAIVTCSSTGSEATDHLLARIKDFSPPVAGLLINLQLFKGNKAVSITDHISGDSNYSDYISLQGGNGTYYMMVNKTNVGERTFDIDYHCMAASGAHTETEIGVLQFH